jgi:pyridoxamine 5'-phosphate oxidase-like protein
VPKSAGRELTDDLFRRLCGKFVDEHAHKVVLIHTIDEQGWPHPAILSYYEVAAKDRRNLRLATYKTSRTTQNIARTGKVTLSIFDERVVYYIKGTAEVSGEMQCAPHNVRINVLVDEVLIDQADPVLEPGAYITAGITYTNPNPPGDGVLRELNAG